LAKFNKREAVDCLCGNFYDMTQEERERECENLFANINKNNTETNSDNGSLPERNNHHSRPPMMIMNKNTKQKNI